jgi:hypothetical protein
MRELHYSGIPDVWTELSELKSRLENRGIYNIYWKELGRTKVADHDIFVVKVLSPDMEGISLPCGGQIQELYQLPSSC